MVIEVRALEHRFCPKCKFCGNRWVLRRHAWDTHQMSLVGVPTDFAYSCFDVTLRAGGRFCVVEILEPQVAASVGLHT